MIPYQFYSHPQSTYYQPPIYPQIQNIPNQLPIYQSNRRLQHVNCILEMNEQMGGLFIGDLISVVKPGILQSCKIQALLACSFEQNTFHTRSRSDLRLETKIIDCHDTMDYPIIMHLETTFDFIEKNRLRKKNVLVHCHAGVSRSGTIICAYLMKKNQWTAQQALSFARSKRQRVKPNANFWNQLLQYGKTLQVSPSQNQSPQKIISESYCQTPITSHKTSNKQKNGGAKAEYAQEKSITKKQYLSSTVSLEKKRRQEVLRVSNINTPQKATQNPEADGSSPALQKDLSISKNTQKLRKITSGIQCLEKRQKMQWKFNGKKKVEGKNYTEQTYCMQAQQLSSQPQNYKQYTSEGTLQNNPSFRHLGPSTYHCNSQQNLLGSNRFGSFEMGRSAFYSRQVNNTSNSYRL